MAFSFKHSFVSAKADGTDASVLRPSNWNAEHEVTCATNVILGRNTAGAGAVEELPTSDAVIALLASATLADLLIAMGVSPPTTGDGRLTLKTTATTGWVMMNDGTIGDASSSASTRANADTAALFALLYDNVLDASAPVYTSAGVLSTRAVQGTAAVAYAAHCRIALTKQLGRAIVGAGAGSGLTTRALGSAFGAETFTLAAGNIPTLTSVNAAQDVTISYGGAIPRATGGAISQAPTVSSGTLWVPTTNAGSGDWGGITSTTTPNSISVAYTNASPTAVALAQASAAWNVMVKL